MKICTTCKEMKPLTEYFNSKTYSGGKGYRCKPCDSAARKSYEVKHKDRMRNNRRRAQRKFKYGLDEDQFNLLLESQNGCCAICSCKLIVQNSNKHSSDTLCVDHSHETGEVRGLLCTNCNRALGLLKDNITSLESAIKYLKRIK